MQNRDFTALARRMMNVNLKITTFPHAEGIVENTLLLNDIAGILPRIKTTLAQRLHNGSLDFTLRLAEQTEIAHRLTPHEVFQKLVDTIPSFSSFKDELQLEVEA